MEGSTVKYDEQRRKEQSRIGEVREEEIIANEKFRATAESQQR